MRICLDPGHGGTDPGAIGPFSLKEASVNLAVCMLARDLLAHAGHTVIPTRITDQAVSLKDRSFHSNANDCDLFISVHCNAAARRDARGIEAWTTPGRTKADEWADKFLASLSAAFPTEPVRRDTSDGDGDKEGHLSVLVHTSAPAVLLELGFISNPETEADMRMHSWKSAAAIAIATAVGQA